MLHFAARADRDLWPGDDCRPPPHKLWERGDSSDVTDGNGSACRDSAIADRYVARIADVPNRESRVERRGWVFAELFATVGGLVRVRWALRGPDDIAGKRARFGLALH